MDSHEEDGEIRDEGRHNIHASNDDHEVEEDEFSMSSYDGDQGDSLDIKPPQAVVQRREKREKREKRDRHRHKGERHKDRHRSREHRSHEERRREHRRHRDRGDGGERRENRDGRRHEKHKDRSSKHERPVVDLRTKLDKGRKMVDREMERRRDRGRDIEYYIDDKDQYEPIDYHREHSSRGGMGGGGMGASDHPAYVHHRREDRIMVQLSPRERAERERRMERFLVAGNSRYKKGHSVGYGADYYWLTHHTISQPHACFQNEKQKELSQREAESRRQRREEERREEQQMVRHRGDSMQYRHSRPHSPIEMHKKRKYHHQDHYVVADGIDEVTVLSEEEEDGEYEDTVISHDERKGSNERKSDEERKKKKKRRKEVDENVKDEGRLEQSDTAGSGSSDSESDSDSDSTSSETEVEEEAKNEEDVKETKDTAGDQMSVSGSGSASARSGTLSPSQAGRYEDSPSRVEDRRSDREEAEYLDDSPPESPVELKEQLPSYYPAIMGCRSVDEFECLNRIEEGTYGVVYRAREKATNQIVALKRLKMEKEKEGFPITSLREVNTLLKGQHENIVTVREIVVGSNMDKIYIVMDYVEHDLKSLMETMRLKKQMFTIGEVKTLMIQLLRAVHHLHDNWILHRDLKTSNLLLSHRGILKVGDFGLAREYGSPLKHYTPVVVTLWYRAPELLLGSKQYSTHIDVWSVGCIFGELLGMEPMFPGKSEIDQLNKIFKDLGTPSEKIWPGYSQLPLVKKTQFADYPYNHLRERFKTRLSDQGFNLLNRFLTYNPPKRITCQEGLYHEYFDKEPPLPIDPAMFPTWPAKSENPHGRSKKTGISPKPPSGGKNFKDLVDETEELAARGFFLGGANSSGPGFVLKM
ncbi:cyclin-dependent kinase 11B-like isoform X3 [Penaeus japonicus]|uniref:cyclin-dependent kinase 11B-like isoform X3 n=1 Tax=Penaeus japonicus TaxID=27405 RepID=UPI001C716DF9|nr:cyclin-dependent kinase 11B-like isoform X3 [Penaeus japonicus]